MAITRELIQANSAIADLSDDQINAIVTLSQNDENAVISRRIGEIYGGLDADILAASGIAKNGAEKTFDYAKRVIGAIKQSASGVDDLNAQIAALTKEKTHLEKVIADGGSDTETRKALKQAQSDLAAVTKSYTDLRSEFDNEKANYAKQIFGMKIDGEFANATSGLKFKADLPQSVVDIIRKQAVDKVRGMFPGYVDDGKGGQQLVFKASEDGEIMRNPENGLNPYTASELVIKELNSMGVLETTRKQQGAGAHLDTPNPMPTSIDITGARTQNEAYEIIAKALMAQGKTVGSQKFDEAMQQAWKDNNVKSLPIR